MKLLLLLVSACNAAELRVQVFSLFTTATLQVEAPSIRLGGNVLSSRSQLIAKGHSVCAGLVCGQSLRTHGGNVRLSIPGKIERRYPGDLEVTAGGGQLTPVVTIDMENAVAAVVAAEMPDAALEAQSAQAIAARSYYASHKRRHSAADFCDSTHCQFLTVGTSSARDAAMRTRGQLLRYRGAPVPAMYFRSCGGRTLRPEDVKLPGSAFPFAAVECAVCSRDPYRWSSELPEALLPESPSEPARLSLTRRLGWDRFPSNHYTVERRQNKFILHGKGQGHGVGMCQRGAVGMAASGDSFAGILRHYYPAASLGE